MFGVATEDFGFRCLSEMTADPNFKKPLVRSAFGVVDFLLNCTPYLGMYQRY